MTDFSLPDAGAAGRPRDAAARLLSVRGEVLLAAGVGVTIGGLGAAQGGYFPTSWGWSALALFWAAVLALILRSEIWLDRLEIGFIGTLVAFLGWIAASTLWTTYATQTPLEIERMLVYVAGGLAMVLIVRKRSYWTLIVGTWAGISLIAGYALLTRAFPDRLGHHYTLAGYRLSAPLGYWNALGIYAGMGTLLALGIAARTRSVTLRAIAAASLVVLLPTQYLTFSRGAWVGLAFGLVAAFAFESQRLRLSAALFALAPAPVLAVGISSRLHSLTRFDATPVQAVHDGRRLALAIVVLMAVAAGLAVALALAERRLRISRGAARTYTRALAVLGVVLLLGVFVRYGSPPTLAKRLYHGFNSGPRQINGNLNKRLFSLSGSGRQYQWRVAWLDVKARPLLGSGAGSYEQFWTQYRKVPAKIRDAHTLYLEQLAELGPFGLLVLLSMFALPLVAAVRARGTPLVPAAASAYVAYLVHAGVDWDWEMTALTLSALFCGVAMLAAARQTHSAKLVGTKARVVAVVAVLGLTLVALVGLLGNSALSASSKATTGEHWARAEAKARNAHRWAPWSPKPWQLLGEAQLQQGKLIEAAASFEQAIAKDPNNWNLWLDLAFASQGPAQRKAALEALRLNPLSPEIDDVRAGLGLPPRKQG